jgi:small basic protein
LPDPDGITARGSVAIIEEFRVLHDEVRSRLEKQQEITSYAIAFLAAIAVASSFLSRERSVFERLAPTYPVISFILSGFTLMVVDHDMNIAHIYSYIDTELAPQLIYPLDGGLGKALGWNHYRARQQQGVGWKIVLTGPISAAKYVMTLVPNLLLAASLAYYGTANSHGWLTFWYFLPSFTVLWTLCASLYIVSLYIGMLSESP